METAPKLRNRRAGLSLVMAFPHSPGSLRELKFCNMAHKVSQELFTVFLPIAHICGPLPAFASTPSSSITSPRTSKSFLQFNLCPTHIFNLAPILSQSTLYFSLETFITACDCTVCNYPFDFSPLLDHEISAGLCMVTRM